MFSKVLTKREMAVAVAKDVLKSISKMKVISNYGYCTGKSPALKGN